MGAVMGFSARTWTPAATGLAMLVMMVQAGCSPPSAVRKADGAVATGKIDFQKEATTGRVYHLYIPTTYTPKRAYPLVVSGHGAFPFDQAQGQRDRWADIAERYGLIVCCPDLDSATPWLDVPKDHPAPELVRDEKAIVAIVKDLQARYNINRTAIMITGWSAGGFAAHFVGLKHPEIFRCIVGRAANFKENLVPDDVALRARHMHVYLFFGEGDLPGWDTMNRDANFWYTVRGFHNFVIRQLPGGHDPNQPEAARYFLNIVNHWPAIQVDASTTEGSAPLSVTLRALVRDPDSPDGRVDSVLWNMGDGAVSSKPEVTHVYEKPGTYNVFLTVKDLDGHLEYTQAWIKVN